MASERKRLCYVLPEYSSRTCSHAYHTWELIEDLAQRMRIYLFIERADEPPELPSADHIYVQKFTGFPLRLLERLFLFLLIRLRGYQDFYVHISHFSSIVAAVVARLSGGRVYYWNCGLRTVSAQQQKTFLHRVRHRLLNECAFRWNLKMINYLVTGTPLMAEYYSRSFGIAMKKIKVIPNSINLERFRQPDKEHKVELMKDLGISDSNRIVLFVHWLSERKGAQYLPEIIEKVTAEIPGAVFVIAGDGPDRDKLLLGIKDAGLEKNARVIGGVPNAKIPQYYALADLFIMPSTDEGFPRVLLEAMAMGAPFVANDVGGVRDIITQRQLEFITPVGDVTAFSDKIISLLKDNKLRDELKAEGYLKVKQFEKQAVADMFASMLSTG
jgi:glycosyltransferase involved in cell wall biosynthesis